MWGVISLCVPIEQGGMDQPPPLENPYQNLAVAKKKQRAIKKVVPDGWESGKTSNIARAVSASKRVSKNDSDSGSDSKKAKKKRKRDKHKEHKASKHVIRVGPGEPPLLIKTEPLEPLAPPEPAGASKCNHKDPSPAFNARFGMQNLALLPRQTTTVTQSSLSQPALDTPMDPTRSQPDSSFSGVQVIAMEQLKISLTVSRSRSIEEAETSLSNALNLDVDEKIKNGLDNSKKDKRKLTAKMTRINQEREKQKEEFFREDTDDGPFGEVPSFYRFLDNVKHEWDEMEEIRAASRDKLPFGEISLEGKEFQELPECSVEYLQDFLREAAQPHERSCVYGNQCISKVMALNFPDTLQDGSSDEGFVCREFLLPDQVAHWQLKQRYEHEQPQPCLLDNLALITYGHFYYLQKKLPAKEILQNFRVPMGYPGGYPADICLYPTPGQKLFTGIVRPIRRFDLLGYRPGTVAVPGCAHRVRCWRDDYSQKDF